MQKRCALSYALSSPPRHNSQCRGLPGLTASLCWQLWDSTAGPNGMAGLPAGSGETGEETDAPGPRLQPGPRPRVPCCYQISAVQSPFRSPFSEPVRLWRAFHTVTVLSAASQRMPTFTRGTCAGRRWTQHQSPVLLVSPSWAIPTSPDPSLWKRSCSCSSFQSKNS